MNLTVLALLQGRLWQAAVEYDARLHRESADSRPFTSNPQRVPHDDVSLSQPAAGALEGELRTVLQALARIEEGRYGFCESCRQPIDPDQLFDRPQRFACASCDSCERQT